MDATGQIPITILLGATATGKSALALEAARMAGAEIISADSMQIYVGMDIGTAKPSPAERTEVPHHLLDICDPADSFNVADFVRAADKAAEEIRHRGRPILMVGGTALYLKGFIEGIFEGPGRDPGIRGRLEQEAQEVGLPAMHAKLRSIDPEAARRIHTRDERRIIRALEVWELTHKPISHWQTQEGSQRQEYAFRLFGLRMPRETLYRRINARVNLMLEQGMVEETRNLLARPRGLGDGALQAVGYREIISYLKGELGYDLAVHQMKQSTRRFAKHQTSWFKRFGHVKWVDLDGTESPKSLAVDLLPVFFV
jgi:tRNA dimethylallyltransferase